MHEAEEDVSGGECPSFMLSVMLSLVVIIHDLCLIRYWPRSIVTRSLMKVTQYETASEKNIFDITCAVREENSDLMGPDFNHHL